MGFAYLIVGCFFLLNPSISIFDLLPDFIGYACILKGISKVSKLSADFESAYRDFRNLFIITLIRMLTLPLAGGSDQLWMLLVVFCFGLIEAFFTCRAFTSLFEGFSYTAERGESNAVFGKWSETRLITLIFLIARQALCILPELSLLSSSDYGVVSVWGVQSLAQYRLIFNLFAAIFSLAIGIFWFIKIRKYFKGIKEDRDYMTSLEEKYRIQIGENQSVLRRYALRFSTIMLAIAAPLSLELPFDGFNYLPHTVFALLITIAAFHLTPYMGSDASKPAKWSLLYTIVSGIVWIYNLIYVQLIFGDMLASTEEGLTVSYASVLKLAVQKDFFALDGFVALCVLTLLEAICFSILVFHLTKLLNRILLQHTPLPEKYSAVRNPEEESLDVSLPSVKDFAPVAAYSRVTCMKISGWICAAMTPIQTVLSFLFPAFWLISAFFRVIWAILFYLTVSKARELVNTSDYEEISKDINIL